MFVAAEVLLDLSFPTAEARLANLARGGLLTRASEGAYGDGLTGLVRVGPLGDAPGMSKLVAVHFLDLLSRGESAVLVLRWEATGPGGRLFPALDADVSLTPAGEQSTRLSLAGAYRPPLAALGAGLDRAIFHRVADATVQSFLARVADALARPQESAGAMQKPT
jgi:carbon monoxide dehydrogenase subunit G